MKFAFTTNDKSDAFFREIARHMVSLFDIREEEAIGRINARWRGSTIADDDDIIYHEKADYWANSVYFGHDSLWWTKPKNLKPLPFPGTSKEPAN